MNELEQVREIFLSDVDEETKAENLQQIREWEHSINENSAFLTWKEQELTQEVFSKAKETYVDIGITLANNRELSEQERLTLYSKQDACTWLLSLIAKDARAELETVNKQIRHAINATKI